MGDCYFEDRLGIHYEIIANYLPSITFRREIIQDAPTVANELIYPGSFFVNSAHSIFSYG